jgi:hypothetical protein
MEWQWSATNWRLSVSSVSVMQSLLQNLSKLVFSGSD